MKVSDWFRRSVAGAAVMLGGALMMTVSAQGQLVTVAFDDFEGLTLRPFDVANDNGKGDGTDWTKNIRTGTARAWTVDNSQMGAPAGSAAGGVCAEIGYNGWSAMDVDSWIDEQGVQAGRTTLGAGTNNTALVSDPDAYYDFDEPAQPGLAYNSYISRQYNLAGFNVATLSITFDWEFAIENAQRGVVEVSFDNGTTWQNLIDVDSNDGANDVILTGPSTFVEGTHFDATSNTMLFRIGCLTASNNWWFAVDNIAVTTADGFSDVEDFEGLTLEPFGVAAGTPPGDGTDYTDDVTNWTIDNSGMLAGCDEGAFDGWAAMDSDSWVNQQGGQGRTALSTFGTNNTLLVADGDAFYDFDFSFNPPDPVPAQAVNTYISRTYDLTGYDSRTVRVSLDFEFRIENAQRGTIEVSFDNGATWATLEDIDNADGMNTQGANDDFVTTQFDGNGFPIPYVAGTDFPARISNSMILRIGYLNADNNWWFAVDNVRVEAEVGGVVLGDANGDGSFDFGDIEAFFLAITDLPTYTSQYPLVDVSALDMNNDGNTDFGDIEAFFVALTS